MNRWNTVVLAVLTLLILPETCRAQRELFARIKKVTEVAIWQREPLGQKESRKILQDLKSPDQQTMQAAFEQLALSRPLPAFADLVVAETQNAVKRSRDKFAMAMAFEIKGDWNEAKQAAETLQAAKRSGGFRYLEQVIVRGNASQMGGAIIAVAYSGNSRAANVVANYWRKSKIPGLRALLILGPPAADFLVEQLDVDDNLARRDVADVLGKIGTRDHIPAMKKAMVDARPNDRRQLEESIKKIEARTSAAEEDSATGKKKKTK